jgi:hypothetical protein
MSPDIRTTNHYTIENELRDTSKANLKYLEVSLKLS